MKHIKYVRNEITKLRKILRLQSSTEQEKDRAWYSMLSLQWVLAKEKQGEFKITPANICKPNLGRERKEGVIVKGD